jgi:hypothetical protein
MTINDHELEKRPGLPEQIRDRRLAETDNAVYFTDLAVAGFGFEEYTPDAYQADRQAENLDLAQTEKFEVSVPPTTDTSAQQELLGVEQIEQESEARRKLDDIYGGPQ